MTTQQPTITYDNAFPQPWIVTTGDWETEEFSTLTEAQQAFPDAELDAAAEAAFLAGID